MESGQSHTAADLRRDAVDKLFVLGEISLESLFGLCEYRSVGGVLQALDEAVYLS